MTFAACTAVELARMIATGEVSSLEVTDAALARLARLEPGINAFVTVLADEARAAARSADRRRSEGRSLGTLHGVPLSIKDLIAVRDAPLTWAHESPLF